MEVLFDGVAIVISYLCVHSQSDDTNMEAVLESMSVEFKEIRIFL